MKKLEKVLKNIKTRRSIHYAIIIIIGILVTIPFLWVQIYNSDDGRVHLLRLIGTENALQHSTFPFLVAPFFCNDWGYSMSAFYPPIVTYIPYILGIFFGTFANGLKLFAGLTTILSGIFMYNFINEVTKKKGIAILAGILYIIYPYRFEDTLNRYAIGEFTSFVFIPIVFQGMYNLLYGDRKRHYYITIGATGLIFTHTISTVFTAMFCVIYVLISIKKLTDNDRLKKIGINILFILLLTALFWIPMLEFKSQEDYSIFNTDLMRTSSAHVETKTIEPWQFLKDKETVNPVSFIVGIPFVTMFFIGILVYKKIDKTYKRFYITSIILGIFAMFMCTKYFPWKYMPDFFCTIQYPWRMLEFATFFLTPICAINIYYLINLVKKEWIRNLLYLLLAIILAVFTISELKDYKTTNTALDAKYEETFRVNKVLHYFSINRDYLPVSAISEQNGYLKYRSNTTYVVSGNAEIRNEEKNGLHLKFELQNVSEGTELELPYIFYPGYTVKLQYNNKEIKLDTKPSEYGFVKVTIPDELKEGSIMVDYTATTLDKFAYILSGISLILFVAYILYFRKKLNNLVMNNGPEKDKKAYEK